MCVPKTVGPGSSFTLESTQQLLAGTGPNRALLESQLGVFMNQVDFHAIRPYCFLFVGLYDLKISKKKKKKTNKKKNKTKSSSNLPTLFLKEFSSELDRILCSMRISLFKYFKCLNLSTKKG